MPVLPPYRRSVSLWLFLCCFGVCLMVTVGGITRLTDSGLSIVAWKPVHGIIPPLGAAEWQEEFAAYQQSPEYRKINYGMTLRAFKGIFWWEYGHRLLGRLVGLLFFLPYAYFLYRKAMTRRFALRLGGIFLLGGAQGFMGWYMVQSGLIDRPDVSQYRLAAHLLLATLIFSLLLWSALDAWSERKTEVSSGLYAAVWFTITLLFLQIGMGALVAGLDAGLTYNTWPLMDGRWIPDGLALLHPWWRNPFENITAVQFQHRMGAYVTALAVMLLWWRLNPIILPPPVRKACTLLPVMLIIQLVLGIMTLLYVVPVALAILHQLGAIMLLGINVWIAHGLKSVA